MKLTEAEALVGQMVTTRQTKWGGGKTVIILGTGWEQCGSSWSRKYRPCTPYSQSRNGVAVAEKWGDTWHGTVIPAQQLVNVTPDEVKAKQLAEATAHKLKWEQQRAAQHSASLVADLAHSLGFKSVWESGGRLSISTEDLKTLLGYLPDEAYAS